MTLKEMSITPQNDYLFKSIFAKEENKEVLRDFLEGILETKIGTLSEVKQDVINKENVKDYNVDIQAVVNDDIQVNIKKQVIDDRNATIRSVTTVMSSYYNLIRACKNYKKVALIYIPSFNIFPEDDDYIIGAGLMINQTTKLLTDDIQLYYVQLPKFIEKKDKPNNKLTQWLYFISQEDKKGLEMAMKENKEVAEAQKQLTALLNNAEVKQKILEWEQSFTLSQS